MKLLVDIIGGIVIGVLAAVILRILNIEITGAQSAILIASIVIITSIVHTIIAKIHKRIDEKKNK